MSKKIDVNEFCERVNRAYDGRISVVKETYVNTRLEVTAYCNVHLIYFVVNEAGLLHRGLANCPECNRQIHILNDRKKPWLEVLKSFREKYGDKFSYYESTYKGTKKPMKVRCNDCGEVFKITPVHHLKYNNGGCPNCHKYKIVFCSKCGKLIKIDRRTSTNFTFVCDDCIKAEKEQKRLLKEQERLLKEQKRKERLKNQKNKVNREVHHKRHTCPFCGSELNSDNKCEHQLCNEHQSVKWFKKLIPFGFDYSKIGTTGYFEEFYKAVCVILIEYFDNMLSPKMIYEKYNCKEYFKCETNILNIIKSVGFKIRNLSEGVSNSYQFIDSLSIENRTYHCGTLTTWNNKTFYYRSSYEKDFSDYLNEQKIDYDMEALRIKYYDSYTKMFRFAVPDFYLPETNTIVEVKSKWTLDKQNMIDKRKAYLKLGYNFKLLYEHEFVELDDLELKDNINNYRK